MSRRLGDISGFNAPDASIIKEDRVLFAAWFNGPTFVAPPLQPGRPTAVLGTVSAPTVIQGPVTSPTATQGTVILPTATLGPGPY